jgi:hypothetical protein
MELLHPARWALQLLTCWTLAASAVTSASTMDIVNVPPASGPASELHIARLVYDHGTHSNWGPGKPWWRIDWPDAEFHFVGGIERYTAIEVAPDSVHMSLDDPHLFDYPWLFAQQVGHWQLSQSEVLRLREYLQRGGFLVVDDFHGPADWQVFESVIRRVLPELAFTDLDGSDELLHVLYELDETTQIPGRRHLRGSANGQVTVSMPYSPPRWIGIHDEQGRLMVAINFNMDMGDAWEHADDPVYPVPMTSLAYRFGINYLIYAMTH